jgi:hypothetical protein
MEAIMSSKTSPFDIPADMRKMTEKSMEQVRAAINGYIQFLQRAVPDDAMGGSELSSKVLTYAERNLANAFEFGQRLLQVRDVQGLLQLQMEFVQRQTQALAEQAFDLRETTTKAVMESVKSKFLCS